MIGPHIVGTISGREALIRRWQPRVALLMDPSPGDGRRFKDLSQGTFLIGRVFREDSEIGSKIESDPRGAARWGAELVLAKAAGNEEIDVWQFNNEVAQRGTGPLARLAEFSSEYVRILAEQGLAAAIGCFAVGNPEAPPNDGGADWGAFLPALRAGMRHNAVLLLHAYGGPRIYDKDENWWLHRYERVVRPHLPADVQDMPYLYGEYGCDMGVVREGERKGWRTGYNNDAAGYVADLRRAAKVLAGQPSCLGACVYTWGGWADFDIDGPAVETLAATPWPAPQAAPPRRAPAEPSPTVVIPPIMTPPQTAPSDSGSAIVIPPVRPLPQSFPAGPASNIVIPPLRPVPQAQPQAQPQSQPVSLAPARERIGIDANNPLAGRALAPQVADPAIIAGTGVGWVRLNFVRGGWESVEEPGWEAAFRQIVGAYRQRGLKIYGLIGHEALDTAHIDEMRDPPPAGASSHPWIDRYVATFASIVRRFHDDVAVWESFNEPDDWHGASTDRSIWPHPNWVHPGWFAVILERVYNEVKYALGLAEVILVSGPLQGLQINNNKAAEYLRCTYREGKERFHWGRSGRGFPFDGVGYHIYIEEGAKAWKEQARLVPAKYRSYLEGMKAVIRDEEGGRKSLYISEAGWHSNGDQETFQARNVELGLNLLLQDPWVALAVWFCTQDFAIQGRQGEEPRYYGVYRRGGLGEGDRKPAFETLQAFCAREWQGLPPGPALQRPQTQPLPAPPAAPTPPQPVFRLRYGSMPPNATNQQVVDAFKKASNALGMGNWGLMAKAGLVLSDLAGDQARRQRLYTGPALEDLGQLTAEERYYIRQALPDDISFEPALASRHLRQRRELVGAAMAPPPALCMAPAAGPPARRRLAAVWNRFAYLLIHIADSLDMEPTLAAALVAAARGRPGLDAAGRLVLSFRLDAFYERWGREHEDLFGRHFSFDPDRPRARHRWRRGPDAPWQELHRAYDSEWAALTLALDMAEDAALQATAMGFPRLMGHEHAAAGYDSARALFDAFASSERFQILALFDLIAGPYAESHHLQALRDRDPEALAPLQPYLPEGGR